jgi:hypothetical protein
MGSDLYAFLREMMAQAKGQSILLTNALANFVYLADVPSVRNAAETRAPLLGFRESCGRREEREICAANVVSFSFYSGCSVAVFARG